jgi:probable phosphoglycerate mutase
MAAEYRQARFARPPGATDLILVRHGESAPHRPGESFALVDGHGDPELSELGRWQADRVADRLADEPIDAIYVSSLRRTHETAAPLAARLGIEPVVEPDLREVHLGEWEGGEFRVRAAAQDPAWVRMRAEERWDAIPGGESNESLTARTTAAVARIRDAHPDAVVVAAVHGGVIGALLAHAAGSRPFAFNGADNGSIHHLVVMAEHWIVRRYNDTGHLGGLTSAAAPPT